MFAYINFLLAAPNRAHVIIPKVGSYVKQSKDGKIIPEVDIAVSETFDVWGKYAKKMA
jgi:hypothetical protein